MTAYMPGRVETRVSIITPNPLMLLLCMDRYRRSAQYGSKLNGLCIKWYASLTEINQCCVVVDTYSSVFPILLLCIELGNIILSCIVNISGIELSLS
jgi:seryl-tRNA(Sec) selenium transferase